MDLIPWEIASEEVLIRFVFLKDFKSKKELIKKRIKGDIFFPYLGGVSLQRFKYTTEKYCRRKALSINNDHKGYLVFKKGTFIEIFNTHKEKVESFNATIEGTPMDEKDEYYPIGSNIRIDTKGSPAHADIKYNKASTYPETPKAKMRILAREMIKSCEYIKEDESLIK